MRHSSEFNVAYVRTKQWAGNTLKPACECNRWDKYYPTGRKLPWEFKFCYCAYGKFAKLKFCLLLDFYKSFNDTLYNKKWKVEIA